MNVLAVVQRHSRQRVRLSCKHRRVRLPVQLGRLVPCAGDAAAVAAAAAAAAAVPGQRVLRPAAWRVRLLRRRRPGLEVLHAALEELRQRLLRALEVAAQAIEPLGWVVGTPGTLAIVASVGHRH